jgi:hypothetical protein
MKQTREAPTEKLCRTQISLSGRTSATSIGIFLNTTTRECSRQPNGTARNPTNERALSRTVP